MQVLLYQIFKQLLQFWVTYCCKFIWLWNPISMLRIYDLLFTFLYCFCFPATTQAPVRTNPPAVYIPNNMQPTSKTQLIIFSVVGFVVVLILVTCIAILCKQTQVRHRRPVDKPDISKPLYRQVSVVTHSVTPLMAHLRCIFYSFFTLGQWLQLYTFTLFMSFLYMWLKVKTNINVMWHIYSMQ